MGKLGPILLLVLLFTLRTHAGPVSRVIVPAEALRPNCPFVLAQLPGGDEDVLSFYREILASGGGREEILVALDRLEDRGQTDRVEMARKQIELEDLLGKHGAHRPQALPLPVRAQGIALEKRIQELARANGANWIPEIPYVLEYEFRNGMPYGAQIDLSQLELFLKKPNDLAAYYRKLQAAGIQRISFLSLSPRSVVPHINNPAIEGFKEIEIAFSSSHEDLTQLARISYLKNLERLDLSRLNLTPSERYQIESSPYLKNLKRKDSFSDPASVLRAPLVRVSGGWTRFLPGASLFGARVPTLEMRAQAYKDSVVARNGADFSLFHLTRQFPKLSDQASVLEFALKDARFRQAVARDPKEAEGAYYYAYYDLPPEIRLQIAKAVVEYQPDLPAVLRTVQGAFALELQNQASGR